MTCKYHCRICGLNTNNVRYLTTQDCIDGKPVCIPCFEDAYEEAERIKAAIRFCREQEKKENDKPTIVRMWQIVKRITHLPMMFLASLRSRQTSKRKG